MRKKIGGLILSICMLITVFIGIPDAVHADNLSQISIEEITLNTDKIDAPGKIDVNFVISNNQNIIGGSVTFVNQSNDVRITANLSRYGEEFKGEIDINKGTVAGRYVIDSVLLVDNNNEIMEYSLRDEYSLSFDVTNQYMIDEQGPQLHSLKVVTSEVNVPGTAKIEVSVSDAMSEISEILVIFKDEVSGKHIEFHSNDCDDTIHEIQLNETEYPAGKYELHHIYMTDSLGNYTAYHTEKENHNLYKEKIPSQYKNLCITVENKFEVDEEGPQLHGLKVVTPEVSVPETAKIELNVSDEMSEIREVLIIFKDEVSGKQIEFHTNNIYDTIYETRLSETEYPAGKYELHHIYMMDSLGNYTAYHTEKENHNLYKEKIPSQYKNLYITVENKFEVDEEGPQLHDLKVVTPEVSMPGIAKIEVSVSDKQSKISEILVIFKDEVSGKHIEFHSNDCDDIIHEIQLSETEYPAGRYELYHIFLTDSLGNQTVYHTEKEEHNLYKEKIPSQYKNLCITIANERGALVIPKVNKISFDKDIISLPNSVGVTLSVSNEINGVSECKLVYSNENTKTNKYVVLKKTYYDVNLGTEVEFKDGMWHGEINLDQYQQSGQYSIVYLQVTDNYGNSINFYTDSTYDYVLKGDDIDLYFTVRENIFAFDSEYSSVMDDFYEFIAKSGDNDIIFVDITDNKKIKELFFEYMKGSDRTVLFKDDTIKWMFEGSDIIKEPKDIDLNVEIKPLEECDSESKQQMKEKLENVDSMLVSFPENGELSGKCKVSINADYSMKEYLGDNNLYVYYHNPQTDSFEPIAMDIAVSKDNAVEFYINHCSDYIITNDKLPERIVDTTNMDEEILEENNNISQEKEESVDTNILTTEGVDDETEQDNVIGQKDNENGVGDVIGVIIVIIVIAAAAVALFFVLKRKGWKLNI